jgi:hypothetical protein
MIEEFRSMSVHGEYSRALEALLAPLRQIELDVEREWVVALENARIGAQRDLSAAANTCLIALEAIDAERHLSSSSSEIGPENDALRAPFQHLKSHCEALLGPPGQHRAP